MSYFKKFCITNVCVVNEDDIEQKTMNTMNLIPKMIQKRQILNVKES